MSARLFSSRQPSLAEWRAVVAAGPPYSSEFIECLLADTREGARALHASCLRRIAAQSDEAARLERMRAFEREAEQCGFARIAGVDEAGRGPLAGPIVAAAVVLAEPVAGLNDSKQVPPERREALFELLTRGSHAIGVAIVDAAEIDRHGIQTANYAAMLRAVDRVDPLPDFLLVDGLLETRKAYASHTNVYLPPSVRSRSLRT